MIIADNDIKQSLSVNNLIFLAVLLVLKFFGSLGSDLLCLSEMIACFAILFLFT